MSFGGGSLMALIQKVINKLIAAEYKLKCYESSNENARVSKLLSLFEHVYFDANEREAYLLIEKANIFSPSEIDQLVDEIAGFITLRPNDILKYNINLVLLCPLQLYNNNAINESDPKYKILSYEKDRYFCRKFLLDTTNPNFEEEIDLLPFMPVDVDFNQVSQGYDGLIIEVKKLFDTEEFFGRLSDGSKPLKINEIGKYLIPEGHGTK